ncbi:MAG: GtrA family protein [Oscillospiraceae bacterium]|nr:GtrA family protein [Oscillospiraceae bacterium]
MLQIIRFGFVGVLCTGIDFAVLLLLVNVCSVDKLVANVISFTVSVTVNYVLSMKFVFEADENKNKVKEFIVFLVLSVTGLGINELIFWLCSGFTGITPSKVIATAVVMVYNFVTRKIFIEKKPEKNK